MRPGVRSVALFGAFSAAVFGAVYLLPPSVWPWLGLALLAPAGLFVWRRRAVAALVCLGAAAGLLWCGGYRAVFFSPAQALNGQRTQVSLRVAQRPTAGSRGGYVPCWVIQTGRMPVKGILCGDDTVLDLRPGDRVSVTADCAQTALLPDAAVTSWAARGVFLQMDAQSPLQVERVERTPLWCLPECWGDRLAGSIRAAFPDDVSALFAAVSAGDRSGLVPAVKADLSRAGLSHLVALSGMHICFLVGLLTVLTGYGPRKRLLLCGPVLLIFTLAVGGAPSVARACCLQLSVLLADVLGRETHRWTSLLATLTLLLLMDPFSAASVSLQLSFAAVAGIGLITPRVDPVLGCVRLEGEGRWRWLVNRLLRLVLGILSTTLGALTFTLPLCAYYFGTVSLAAPLSNLLVLPVASALFAGGLLTGLLGMLWPGGAAFLGAIFSLPGRYVLWTARWISAIPFSSVPANGPCALALAGAYGIILLALLPRGRRRLWVLAVCAATLVGGGVFFALLDRAALTVAVLDVGQGQCVVLCSDRETAVIDCGGTGHFDAGDLCADYLAAQGRTQVDKLILTHCHTDHISGLGVLFQRLEVREMILPRADVPEQLLDLAGGKGTAVTWLDEDKSLPLGRSLLRLYAPTGGGDTNEDGLSVLLSDGTFHMLITGDMDAAAEERLTARADLPMCQVLVVGHHGSATACGEALLDVTSPQCAVISVGQNYYGHPADQTVARLIRRGVRIYRTDQIGTVTIQVP